MFKTVAVAVEVVVVVVVAIVGKTAAD